MFWRLQAAADEGSQILHFLEDKDARLSDILNDPFALQELKCGNERLITYLKREDILIELVRLCISEPNVSEDNRQSAPVLSSDKKYKNAYLASEILAADPNQLITALCQDDRCIDELFTCLTGDQLLNPLLASFFSKIFCLMVQCCQNETMQFIRKNPTFLDGCMKHLGNHSIAEALLRLCTCIGNDDEALHFKQFLSTINFAQSLLSTLSPNHSHDVSDSATFLLANLITCLSDSVSSETKPAFVDPLLYSMHTRRFFERLIPSMETCSGALNDHHLYNRCAIILSFLNSLPLSVNLLELDISKSFEKNMECCQRQISNPLRFKEAAEIAFDLLANRLFVFLNLLFNGLALNQQTESSHSYAAISTRTQLSLLKVLVYMSTSRSYKLHKEMARLDVPVCLIDSCFTYSMNNLCRSQMNIFIYFVLNHAIHVDDDDISIPSQLLQRLLIDGYIWKFILQKLATNKFDGCDEKQRRSFDKAFLLKWAEMLDEATLAGPHNDLISAAFLALPTDTQGSWKKLRGEDLAAFTAVNQPDKVGFDSSIKFDPLQDDAIIQIGSKLSSVPHISNDETFKFEVDIESEKAVKGTNALSIIHSVFYGNNEEERREKERNASVDIEGAGTSFPVSAQEDMFEELCSQRVSSIKFDDDVTEGPAENLSMAQGTDTSCDDFWEQRSSSSSSSGEHAESNMDIEHDPWADFNSAARSTISDSICHENSSPAFKTDFGNFEHFTGPVDQKLNNGPWIAFDSAPSDANSHEWFKTGSEQGEKSQAVQSGECSKKETGLISDATDWADFEESSEFK